MPFVMGYLLDGVRGGVEASIWGGLVRIAVFQHITWSVNSICHMFGRRDFDVRDESRNNWLLALPSLGEAWHNNHHAFPSSAVHGLGRFQLDLSALVIRGLKLDVHPELEPMMFGNYRRLVYLAQTDDPALVRAARRGARRLGLTFELRRTGYGELATTIAVATDLTKTPATIQGVL